MRKSRAPRQYFAQLALIPLLHSFPSLAADQPSSTYHTDGRSTLKQQFFLNAPQNPASEEPSEIAWSYLRSQAAEFGLTAKLDGIKLSRQKESLIGYHLHFTQEHLQIPIEGAEIIISILKDDRRIYQVYNNLQPNRLLISKHSNKLSSDQAFDIAWQFLGVRGQIFEKPIATLIALPDTNSLQMAWRIELSTTQPYGAWKVYLNSETGKILRYEDQRISHRTLPRFEPRRSQGPLTDRREAFANFQLKSEKARESAPSTLASGVAKVFDPDPRTTLLDVTLRDNSSADRFTAAYFDRELLDIRFDGRRYFLDGPWVKIIDFDPPTNAPSSTIDGKWKSLRGNNAFNDAMTYYHIDKSQRYLQSLGFTGSTGIQHGPIEVDSDGVNGDDNSYFQPSSNRLSFGHGCVDDNEDTDVILHEYGHAIHFSINPNWGGGDMGAIGEGFGDYWAASYSLSTSNGPQFFPNEIYSWDGHGEGAVCWPGRVLNALTARYNPSVTYGAHTPIDGGFQSDELWSTPLFQARVRLLALGIPREEVDRIVLQAQFGLGSNVKMRDMAQSIVAAAELLYQGPHAQIFKENFLRQGILEEAQAQLDFGIGSVEDSSQDGRIDPNEDVTLQLQLSNKGQLSASEIQLTLTSSTPGVSFIDNNSAFNAIEPGKSSFNIDLLRLHLDSSVACGTLIELNAQVLYNKTQSANFPFQLRVGQAVGIALQSTPKLSIPDADSKGVFDSLQIQSTALVSSQFRVAMDIKHPYRGDLKLILIAPSGKNVLLHDRSGLSEDNIIGTYPTTLIPKEELSKILGEPVNGLWQLQVIDTAASDTGSLQSWGLSDITRYQCQ